ncbi:MAG TPA: organic hydroperoxide resistance protein [Allosphingosinicella sp.]
MTNSISKLIYTARTHTTGGRDGTSRTDDGRLEVRLSTPGTSGAGTNPEQLFAAGWSACFLAAIQAVGKELKIAIPGDTSVDAEVDLGTNDGGYQLGARLNVSLPGLDGDTARRVVEAAHQTCPYSKATRGNIEVALNVA